MDELNARVRGRHAGQCNPADQRSEEKRADDLQSTLVMRVQHTGDRSSRGVLTNANCRALQVAGLSPKLMKEIRASLEASQTKLSDMRCDGVRLGRHFVHLGGARIAPYSCDVGRAKPELDGEVEFYDDHGNEDAAPEAAMYVFEHSPSLNWKK